MLAIQCRLFQLIRTNHQMVLTPFLEQLKILSQAHSALQAMGVADLEPVLDAQYEGLTPLCLAAKMGHAHIVRMLVAAGADPNKSTLEGKTPLWFAIEKGSLEIVEFLSSLKVECLKSPAELSSWFIDIDFKIQQLKRKINDCEQTIDRMYTALCDPYSTTKVWGSATNLADQAHKVVDLQMTKLEYCAELEKITAIEATRGIPPLILAIDLNHWHLLPALLKNGAAATRFFPLNKVIEKDNAEVAKLLIEAKVAFDPVALLHNTIIHKSEKCLKLLLDLNVDCNAVSKDGVTPLARAIGYDVSPQMITLLIEKGADCNGLSKNHVDPKSVTPLAKAIIKDDKITFEKLLTAGANINLKVDGQSLIDLSIQLQRFEFTDRLIAVGARLNLISLGDNLLHNHYLAAQNNIVRAVIAAGVDVNAKSVKGLNSVFFTVKHDNVDMLKLLIAAGANINATDKQGRTALYHAAKFDRHLVLEQLLKAGTDVLIYDNAGHSAVESAITHHKFAAANQILLWYRTLPEEMAQGLMQCALEHDEKRTVVRLLALGCDPKNTLIKKYSDTITTTRKKDLHKINKYPQILESNEYLNKLISILFLPGITGDNKKLAIATLDKMVKQYQYLFKDFLQVRQFSLLPSDFNSLRHLKLAIAVYGSDVIEKTIPDALLEMAKIMITFDYAISFVLLQKFIKATNHADINDHTKQLRVEAIALLYYCYRSILNLNFTGSAANLNTAPANSLESLETEFAQYPDDIRYARAVIEWMTLMFLKPTWQVDPKETTLPSPLKERFEKTMAANLLLIAKALYADDKNTQKTASNSWFTSLVDNLKTTATPGKQAKQLVQQSMALGRFNVDEKLKLFAELGEIVNANQESNARILARYGVMHEKRFDPIEKSPLRRNSATATMTR